MADGRKTNQSMEEGGRLAGRGGRAAARGAKSAASAAEKLAVWIASSGFWPLLILVIIILLLGVLVCGTSWSSMQKTHFLTAKNAEEINSPETEEELESITSSEQSENKTIELAGIVEEAKAASRAKIEEKYRNNILNNLKYDDVVFECDADNEEVFVTGEGGMSGTETHAPRILMVDNSKENKRVAERFEKEGCTVTTVFEKSQIDAEKYDALVIPGGNNVTPSLYGEKSKGKPYTTDTNKSKDELQIYAVKQFASKGKPILGLCRGMQLINVAFGGTIDQGDGTYHKNWHKVYFAKGSWVRDIYGGSLKAYHYHKQQVKTLGDGFVADTWSEKKQKGFIEGMHHQSLPIYCTQWHPDVKKMGDDGQKVFTEFVEILKKDMGSRGISFGTGMPVPSNGKYQAATPAIQGAIDWAIMIANDNSFTYGKPGRHGATRQRGWANTTGCYFCGTNSKYKPKGYEKTYNCMTFVHAAFAHGAGDKAMLKTCKDGGCMSFYRASMKSCVSQYKGSWMGVGYTKNLSVSDLQVGDVLVNVGHHVAIYLDQTHVVDAGGYDNGWTDRTIALRKVGKNSWKSYDYVIRYVGGGTGTAEMASTNSLQTYSNLTTVKTVSESAGRKVTLPVTSGYALQAITHSGSTYYFTEIPRSRYGSGGGFILSTDASGNLVKRSDHLSIRHGQGITYNPEDNALYTTTTKYTGNNKVVQRVDKDNLTLIDSIKAKNGASAIGYDRVRKNLVSASATKGLTVYGSSLKDVVRSIPFKRKVTSNLSSQDLCAYNGIAYMTYLDRKGTNYIDMYNLDSGGYLGTYEVPYDELESIDVDEQGQLVLLFNAAAPYMQFTGLPTLNGTGGGGQSGFVTKSTLEVLSGYSMSLGNGELYYDKDGKDGRKRSDGLIPTGKYKDLSGRRIKANLFTGKINFEKDLRKKVKNKTFYRAETETTNNGKTLKVTLSLIPAHEVCDDLFNLKPYAPYINALTAKEAQSEISQLSDSDSAYNAAESWNLILVNGNNPIPEGYTLTTADTRNGEKVDERIKDPLEQMLSDCEKAGYKTRVISGYRTHETQEKLYENAVNKNDTAKPGCSEHEIGLAVDIIDADSAGWSDPLIADQADMPAQKWLMEHCTEYGFILRYPEDKQDKTDIIWEPWHYRYVGKAHAKVIAEKGYCLEEYVKSDDIAEEDFSDQTAGSKTTNAEAIYTLAEDTGRLLFKGTGTKDQFTSSLNTAAALEGGTMAFPLPMDSGWVQTSRYGRRYDVPGSTDHAGVDLGVSSGTPIYAAKSGTVKVAKSTYVPMVGYGKYVQIDHGGGLETIYGHMSKVTAKTGDFVNAGDKIGEVGNTGHSFGAHLHFEVRVNGHAVNPKDYLGGNIE